MTDVEAAWRGFVEFLQTEVDGIASFDDDGDGFIVQWGRYAWNEDRVQLVFTRQLAVVAAGGDEPELWQVELRMTFDDHAAPGLIGSDTGFGFEPIGSARAAALMGVRREAWRTDLVRALWAATPVRSELTLGPVC